MLAVIREYAPWYYKNERAALQIYRSRLLMEAALEKFECE
jgi:hypothetical protein